MCSCGFIDRVYLLEFYKGKIDSNMCYRKLNDKIEIRFIRNRYTFLDFLME